MDGHAWTSSEQVIASIIVDSLCGMSDVAFRTASPIGELSCRLMLRLRGRRHEMIFWEYLGNY